MLETTKANDRYKEKRQEIKRCRNHLQDHQGGRGTASPSHLEKPQPMLPGHSLSPHVHLTYMPYFWVLRNWSLWLLWLSHPGGHCFTAIFFQCACPNHCPPAPKWSIWWAASGHLLQRQLKLSCQKKRSQHPHSTIKWDLKTSPLSLTCINFIWIVP